MLGQEDPFDDGSTRVRPITSDTDPLIGVEAGEYRILSALGVGSMGLVYKGAHQTDGRVVAIKVLKRELIADPSQQRRFLDEARAVAACNHPGIIDVFSVGQLASDEPYLVMEFLEGEPLDARLAREKRLPVDQVLDFGIAIAAALQAAHASGVIHRDLKPPNIFLVKKRDGGFTPKLIDFGLAQRVQSGVRHEQTSIGGTPLYLAPEQARRQPITPQADLYSFGCVLFELLSGKPPFTAGNLHALLDQHASLAPAPLRELVNDVPRALEALVLSMLGKAPEDRPASAEVVRQALEKVRSERAMARRPAPPTEEKTTVSYVHQAPLPSPSSVDDFEDDGPAATVADLPPVLDAAQARMQRLTMATLDTGADDELSPARTLDGSAPALAPAVPRRRAPTQESAVVGEAQRKRRTGEVRARSRTGEAATLEAAPAAPRTKSQSARPRRSSLLPLGITVLVVVLMLGLAVALKASRGEPPPPVPVAPVVVEPVPVEVPVAPPVEVKPTPTPTPDAPVEPRIDGPRQRFSNELARVKERVTTLPKANRARAVKRLDELALCSEPAEKCLQQLRKLERKWFKK